ncbi:uncharacterized protein LOC126892550 [Diabrotica virgifera virgifera]|uniref:DDE Tnp4 domain-containing protein n=1 Tax=Diabrotica virgifera virgifera TaxID=50390 RepID=A0ABM5L6L3_DIAVI|nr:uncharacterized protein LOC126892550 [Diabrotica virgifera virgifera]
MVDNETKFHSFFRVTKNQFHFLLCASKEDIMKSPTRMVRRVITPEEKLGVTLRFLTTGESFHSLRFQFRISHNYISVFVSDVLTAICKRLKNVLMPAPTEDTWKENSIEFWERWNFPNCVGAIDGKHVRIVCPSKSASQFFNYKNYFSIILLVIVDAEYKFTAVDVGSYGKEGDSSKFTKSALGKSLYENTINFPQDAALPGSQKVLAFVIVEDEAFRLHKNLMKPYNRVQAKDDFQKAIFNYYVEPDGYLKMLLEFSVSNI